MACLRAGLVARFPAASRTTPAGSEECVYVLTHRGGRAVLDAVEYAAVRQGLYAREGKHRANFTHHVAVATLQLVLTLGQSGWRLVDFKSEDRDPSACVRVRHRGRNLTAWPDASAVAEAPGGKGTRRLRYLFEIDLTRKSNPRLSDRFAAYAAYAAAARQGSVPATHGIVFAVPGEREIERFIRLAAEAVAAERPGSAPPFLFWNLDDWYAAPGDLRSPSAIVGAKALSTLTGDSRRLIEVER